MPHGMVDPSPSMPGMIYPAAPDRPARGFFHRMDVLVRPIVRISKEEVAKVARLARLELDANEIDSLAADLDSILGYVAKLDELNTTDIVPTSQVVADQPPLRTDEVTNRPCPEDAVANAPETEDGMFVVPSIIE